MIETLSLLALIVTPQVGPNFVDQTQTPQEQIAEEPCPVRFSDFPQIVHAYELNEASLTSPTQLQQITIPRNEGLFLISVSAQDKDPIYGSRRVSVRKLGATVEHPLKMGLVGLDWGTAATEEVRSVSEVDVGLYRVVLQYISRSETSRKSALVCIAVSPTFELTEKLYLHRFE